MNLLETNSSLPLLQTNALEAPLVLAVCVASVSAVQMETWLRESAALTMQWMSAHSLTRRTLWGTIVFQKASRPSLVRPTS